MSSRKLQQEFDKLQKKVAEGLQQFEEIYEKIGVTENPSLKDKLEGDLRKEIKKLQRSRDQVKQWLGDSSNKLDKQVLLDTRSRIENAMERFKEVEKVSKMKQFSNEGLELQTKLGARGLDEARKNDAAKYVVDVLDELGRQNELLQAEMAQHSHKKRLAAAQAAHADAAAKFERNSSHVLRLELVLRHLENHQLEPEKIDEIRDDLDYYVENNQLSDFVEYDDFYEVLQLSEPPAEAPHVAPEVPAELPATPSPRKAHAAAADKRPADHKRAPELLPRKKAMTHAAAAAASAKAPAPPAAAAADSPVATPHASPLPVHGKPPRTAAPFWDNSAGIAALAHNRLHQPAPFPAISRQLEASLLNCPDSFDLERPRQYSPTNVHPSLVDYPQEPMYELNSATLMRKFDTDTLFFCFYYNEAQDALAKWHAARELLRRGWVFNLATKQWFSKEDRPKSRSVLGALHNGDRAAAASFRYFDYENSWLVRHKDNFAFDAELQWTF
ncbi:Not3-domain-containing protein [Metschnikowia bicuspidata var. bicuspidata NRRL YB-4993]|uniref:Not3-domain-containing protein n=1 Tax=Metschnikowia bicuspidata var. bicuspidata NRRL YB-4993 TaxID=869754 RepID=A0A1A0HEK3_9ASCO|nr:Not3-domain-containing protein [Metschnikowia bicuspidata var. bicuspidata NRRL YB-4993]OBA22544.1 Not3-domain-containing protein [Metschnikowia bicuspidata var. bicuspidata NRRL YB-4993]